MKRRIRSVLAHAFQMVGRTIHSYAMLSVTIVLSFSFLLGYLLYTDSRLYNDYKKILRQDQGVLVFQGDGTGDSRMDMLLKKTQEAGETSRYKMVSTVSAPWELPQEGKDGKYTIVPQLYFLPSQVWRLYDFYDESGIPTMEITWLDGEAHEDVRLSGHQILMDQALFELLELDKLDTPIYDLYISNANWTSHSDAGGRSTSACVSAQVVGLVHSRLSEIGQNDRGMQPIIFLPMSILEELDPAIPAALPFRWYEIYYTDAPEIAENTANAMGILVNSVYAQQQRALNAIRSAQSNKAIIAAALMVLLGINLYSSFTNALNDRKFEIGVKRAIGASSFSIVRQFLYESLIVMVANILLSIALVTDVAVIYKYILSQMPVKVSLYGAWTIYLSPYSAGMFGLCAVGLTVVFSLIFAYKSTQVEIVQYLKAE